MILDEEDYKYNLNYLLEDNSKSITDFGEDIPFVGKKPERYLGSETKKAELSTLTINQPPKKTIAMTT